MGFFIESASGQQRLRPHHADRRPREGQRRACADRSVPQSHSSRGVAHHGTTRCPRRHPRTRNFDAKSAACSVRAACPVGLLEGRAGRRAASSRTWSLVDIRGDAAVGHGGHRAAARQRTRRRDLRHRAATDPELILQAMRAGANEFFMWPRARGRRSTARVRRTAARRETAQGSAKPPSSTLVFFGAKGGAGTTTVARELRGGARAADEAADGDRGSQAGLRRGRAVPGRPPAVHACSTRIENLHRLDKDFLHELVREAQVGSRNPGRLRAVRAARRSGLRRDRRAVPRARRSRTTTSSSTPATTSTRAAIAALYAADTIFVVANPDVPSVRNAQRLVDRVRQLGVGGERIRMLLNRASDQHMIAPKQIETALGYADPPHVPERLQDRVHRAQLRRAAGARRTTRRSRRSSTASRARSSRPARRPTKPPSRSASRLQFQSLDF